MASSTIPTHYPQLIDPTRTPLAFLNRAVPRLVSVNTEKKEMIFLLLESRIK
jgi:hypothetical protein